MNMKKILTKKMDKDKNSPKEILTEDLIITVQIIIIITGEIIKIIMVEIIIIAITGEIIIIIMGETTIITTIGEIIIIIIMVEITIMIIIIKALVPVQVLPWVNLKNSLMKHI